MAEVTTRPRFGEGRIAGFSSAAIGLLSIAAVLCLRFPGLLTTPELRVHYDMDLLRLILAAAMVASAALGALTVTLGGPRHRRTGAPPSTPPGEPAEARGAS